MCQTPLQSPPDGCYALTATPSQQYLVRPKGFESSGRGRAAQGRLEGVRAAPFPSHSEHAHDPTRHHFRGLHAAPKRARFCARPPGRGPPTAAPSTYACSSTHLGRVRRPASSLHDVRIASGTRATQTREQIRPSIQTNSVLTRPTTSINPPSNPTQAVRSPVPSRRRRLHTCPR